MLAAFPRSPTLRRPAPRLNLSKDRVQGSMLEVKSEDRLHLMSLFHVDQQLAPSCGDVVAQHRSTADPFTLPARRRHLVPRSVSNHLPLEFGKREKNIQRQPAHRSGGIQWLRDRHQADLAPLEYFHQPRKIQQ